MNILFMAHTYYPNKDGVQMVTQYMAEGLVRLGHSVTVVSPLREGFKREEVHNGVRIVRFEVKTFLKHFYGEKKEFQNFLLKEAKSLDCMIAVCANIAFAAWTYPIVDQLPCRKIMYQHGMYDGHLHLNKVHSFKRLIKQLILTPYWEMYHRHYWKQIMKFDACVHLFENDSSHKYFKEHGFKNNVVIMNSCEPELFEEATDEDKKTVSELSIGEKYFLYVANFCSRKDQMLALESFYQLEENDAELVLVGSEENDYLRNLYRRKAELDKEYDTEKKITILTGLSREKTISLIRECYACLMTSNNEYLPITIIEALACDKPFISTNVGVVADMPGGVIANTGDDIVHWMNYFIGHPEFVQRLGKIGGDYAMGNLYIGVKIRELEMVCEGRRE